RLDLAGTSGDRKPEIAARGDGDFIVTWETFRSSDADGDERSVQALRFASDGTPQGQTFQVNSYTTGDQDNAAVAVLEDGSAFVVWETESDDSEPDFAIRGAFVDASGAFIGAELQINDVTAGNQVVPRIATDGQRRFLVTWESGSSPGTDTSLSVQARLYSIAVTGRAFLDADFDGIQDTGESGLEGVTVHLHDAADGSVLDSTQTDSSGAYLFESGPGDFFLVFEAPAAYVFADKDQGSDDSVDSDVEPSTGQTAEFSALEDGVQDAGLANGVGDRVWLDSDADGLQDGGEPGLGGVTVELFELGGALLSSTASDADGRYAFADLVPGDYYVVFTAPEGFELTSQSQGSDDTADSDADPVTGATPAIVFTPGDLLLDLDAGLVE
ncbi:MAG: SdrD B-like domain-containing protein, partial [Acidobacteriota bacterium]